MLARLHRAQGMDCMGPTQGLWPGFRQADKAYLARLHEFRQRANSVLDGRIDIDPMLIIEVDRFNTQPLQAGLTGRTHVRRAAVDAPYCRVGGAADNPEFGGQHH